MLASGDAKLGKSRSSEDVLGAWLGFDQDGVTFYRIELDNSQTGVCAVSHPGNEEVEIYRIKQWTLDKGPLEMNLLPVTTGAEKIYFKELMYSRASKAQFEVGGINGRWKRVVVLCKEAEFEKRAKLTRQAIQQEKGRRP